MKVLKGYIISIEGFKQGKQIHLIKQLKEHGTYNETVKYYTEHYQNQGIEQLIINILDELY